MGGDKVSEQLMIHPALQKGASPRQIMGILPKPSPQLLNSYLTFIVASGIVTLGFFPPLSPELRVWLAGFL